MTDNTIKLFTTPRVVITRGIPVDDEPVSPVSYRLATSGSAYNGDTSVSLSFQGGSEPVIDVAGELTNDKNTGIITFSDFNTDYFIRPLRDEDGKWLSDLKTPLPVEALMQKITSIKRKNEMAIFPQGATDFFQEESLAAFSYPGSSAVVGLLYNDTVGRWLRIEGDWLLVNDIDDSFILDDAQFVFIDTEKADEFIQMFDENHLDINRISEFAQPLEEEEPASETESEPQPETEEEAPTEQ
jgi:hypothetical protein